MRRYRTAEWGDSCISTTLKIVIFKERHCTIGINVGQSLRMAVDYMSGKREARKANLYGLRMDCAG